MPKSAINFVWFGKPKFAQGGQDVIGPETMDANFKLFTHEGTTPPPEIKFWCQSIHQQAYKDYFANKGVQITVSSVEEYLLAQSAIATPPLSDNKLEAPSGPIYFENAADNVFEATSPPPVYFDDPPSHYFDDPEDAEEIRAILLSSEDSKKQANRVYQHYLESTSSEDVETLDYVYMKDMFFNFLLANEGGYVLDTNIQAAPDRPLIFNDPNVFMYPVVQQGPGSCAEVWMQYSPSDNNLAAKLRLDYYLDQYDQRKELIQQGRLIKHSKDDHDAVGVIAVNTVSLFEGEKLACFGGNQLHLHCKAKLDKSTLSNSELAYSWSTNASALNHYFINGFGGLFKSYSNSHRLGAEHSYSDTHFNVFEQDLTQLRFHLDHGISVNATAKPRIKFGYSYDADDETLLHIAISNPSFLPAAQIVLEKGADPNLVCRQVDYQGAQPIFKSPLTCAINSGSPQALQMLFQYATTPIQMDQMLNNKSDLMCAMEIQLDINSIKLLLEHGADPNKRATPSGALPLHLALRNRNKDLVELLLANGALLVPSYTTYPGGVIIERQITDIPTSIECQTLINDALKKLAIKAVVNVDAEAAKPISSQNSVNPAQQYNKAIEQLKVGDEKAASTSHIPKS